MMKNVKPLPFIAIAILLLAHSACKKNISAGNLTYTNTPLLPPSKTNTAPICYSGQDLLLFLPTNFCLLYGSAYDGENNIQTSLWSKISGPSSFLIEHPNSLSTKVSNLQIGIYQFELTVTDSIGLYGKDTIQVTVGQLSTNSNEIIFQNQTWVYPWYSAIEIKNFYSLIPSGLMFKIFIKRDTKPDWIEAFPVSYNGAGGFYEYFIETRPDGAGMYTYGSLYIFYYGMNTSDTPDVKIVF
jgi:hypothetical protein